ncbi:MAG TPA: hypothetical protein VGK44_03565 [Casimicrobiaceae bacterium]
MGRKASSPKDVIARGCRQAVRLANDPNHLASTSCEQLGVAAAFLARALAGTNETSTTTMDARSTDALRKLEAAGKAIGAELRRRQVVAVFPRAPF